MWSEAVGEVELEDGVLVMRRIHVTYHLKLSPEQRATAERAHSVHADGCPMYRSLRAAIAISTALEMEDVQPEDMPGR